MSASHLPPQLDITVAPLLLGKRHPFVLLADTQRSPHLLRQRVRELTGTIDAVVEEFLVRRIGLTVAALTQSFAVENLEHDPPAVEICYYCFVNSQFVNGDNLGWLPLYQLLPHLDQRPHLAGERLGHDIEDKRVSDHDRMILERTMLTIRSSLEHEPIISAIEPRAFTLSYLQYRSEMLYGVPLHTQNFRRKLLDSGKIESLGLAVTQSAGRPAQLYSVRRARSRS